jgi:hypothetical protein
MHWRSFAAQLTLNSELLENTAINLGSELQTEFCGERC